MELGVLVETINLACPKCHYSRPVEAHRIPAGTKSASCPKCGASFPMPPLGAAATGPTRPCSSCGGNILARAEICPLCGVRVAPAADAVNKVALLLLIFFLGGLGAHRFYLRRNLSGILYLVFFWTYIPSILALIEFVIVAFKSEVELQQRYPEGANSKAVVVAMLSGLVGIGLLGFLAALLIPYVAR